MIWVILFILIIAISFVLAIRSMRNFQELPHASLDYSLFLVRNKYRVDQHFMNRLYSFCLGFEALVSLERLFKGEESALVIYGPNSLAENFPELELLELEDYLGFVSANSFPNPKQIFLAESLAWVIAPKNSPKKTLQVQPLFLKMLDLGQNQQFFWQIVCFPLKDQSASFQVTIRAMVVDKDPTQKIELAKKIDRRIIDDTGLMRQLNQLSSGVVFEAFKGRGLVPAEVSSFTVSADEVLALLGLF